MPVPDETPSSAISYRPRVLAFDSGIGGLGIVGALRQRLPDAQIDYLADTALFPYGEQDDATLRQHILELISDAAARLQPDAVVIACNTASTLALSALRESNSLPFVGCVPPIRWAARDSRSRVIGLLATRATVGRPYVAALQAQYAPDCRLIAHGARHLADIAETVFRGEEVDPALIRRELAGLFEQPDGDRIDAVALGCTHYTFVTPALRAAAPSPAIAWLDPADAVARQTVAVLPQRTVSHALLSQETPGETCGQGTGRAWFTSEPREAEQVRAGLLRFGYRRLESWPPR